MAKKPTNKKERQKIESLIKDNIPSDMVKYITQPLPITLMVGDFTPLQVNLMVEMVDQLQDRVTDALKRRHDPNTTQRSLFSDEELQGESFQIDVPLSSLNVPAYMYKDLQTAAEKMISFKFTKNSDKSLTLYNVFSRIEIPTQKALGYKGGTRRTGVVSFHFIKDNLEEFFDMSEYNKYIKSVTRNAKSQYTSRLYMMITAHKYLRNGWKIKYDELRIILGCSHKNKDGDEKYPNYNDFKKRVLITAQTELENLAKSMEEQKDRGEEVSNPIDCWFEFHEVYPVGKKRGTPEYIVFTIHTTSFGKEAEELTAMRKSKLEIEDYLRNEFGFKYSDREFIFRQLLESDYKDFMDYLHSIKSYLTKNGEKNGIKDVKAYVLKSCRNWIVDRIPEAEIVTKESDPNPTHEPTTIPHEPAAVPEWDRVVEELKSVLIQNEYEVWITPIKAQSFTDSTLILSVPSAFFAEYLENNLIEKMAPTIIKYFGKNVQLKYSTLQ